LISLGCPKNLVDSERILALLAEGGCTVNAAMNRADAIVVNTCGFLSAARDESLGVIREALACKRAGTARRVVVAGCLVNRDARKLYELVPGIDAIVGVNDRDDILSAVTGTGRVTDVSPILRADAGASGSVLQSSIRPFGRPYGRDPRSAILSDSGRFRLTPCHTAYLRISEGCSRRCTFCTIGAIRGPFRSKPPQAVLAEARELIADGAVELNIIGQDTTSYGTDFRGAHGRSGPGLDGLLRDLDKLDGVRWIRLMYAYPRGFTEPLIDAVAQCPRVVKYVDLPLQHINDTVLRRMGRGVTRKGTEKLLERLRRRIPRLVLRTTFIVGFPGESESQFAELLAFARDFRFDALGVFEYSAEEGTPAARLRGAVPAAVKAQRAAAIMLAQRRIAFAANRRKVGRPIEVLVDGVGAAGRCVGRHYGQAPDIDSVCILRRPRPQGSFVSAGVAGSEQYDLIVD
jgi:ribosomal protein S12 methylthiotransferase